jgi:3-phenylpropionate/trans-cinnamate dioxygenase ferredoxin subunit
MFFKTEIHWYKVFESLAEAEQSISNGKTLTKTVAGKKVCLAKNINGFFAVNDRCPHNGFSLGKGICTDDDIIVCPLHRYGFDLKTGRSRAGNTASYVDTYPLNINENGFYIGFERRVFKLF